VFSVHGFEILAYPRRGQRRRQGTAFFLRGTATGKLIHVARDARTFVAMLAALAASFKSDEAPLAALIEGLIER
jgi:hypothetical protein